MKHPFNKIPFQRKKGSTNKYNAHKCEYNGIEFDSSLERDRYIFLKSQEEQGIISDLKIHQTYCILPTQYHMVHKTKQLKTKLKEWDQKMVLFQDLSFTPDFTYTHAGTLIAEDVKGSKFVVSRDFPLRQKLLYFFNGIYCHIIMKPNAPIPSPITPYHEF